MRIGEPPAGLPETAFIHPGGSNRRAVEKLATRILEIVLDWATSGADRPALPDGLADEDLDALLDHQDGEAGILERLRTLMAASANTASPGYTGHMDSAPATISVLGDLVAAALNNNMLFAEMSPVLSALEWRLLRRIARQFGLDRSSGGVLTGGGSLGNLQALAVARNRALGCATDGLARGARRPAILASEAAHSSVHKAAMVLGLGSDAVIPVPTERRGRMDPAALEARIDDARRAGHLPFCVVGTAGTTVTGSIDPLVSLAELARARDLWFHVDAAHGGALSFSPRLRGRLEGIEAADSVVFNPHKWLWVTRTCSMVLFRDVALLDEHFRVEAPYSSGLGTTRDLGEIGVQGTRHADVLKLWLTLQHLGPDGLARLVEAGVARASRLADQIDARPGLTCFAPPDTNIVCFRGTPRRLPESAWEDWTSGLQRRIRRRGVLVSRSRHAGHRWLRAVLMNPYLDESCLDDLMAEVDRYVDEKLGASQGPIPGSAAPGRPNSNTGERDADGA